ncbi:hypothetical protein Kpol_1045p13 [Vanderwaltozyma polyspora DSM 70294]|uniref:Condensin complex subunit 2 n=1 Tax=Vanderwaltozyma polyspora (strain ATCC 22028 / DSM 70294 / BCRC 21397 / CBS 2163 / NBRC 10782 / NRRL Y-8283 / UCD 57-17) TaxID=436907 RepID=A7TI22_VANPO|nr:uncharacterized protein Kpol_1045p13 [Vanderwaltozyma polyspora DSM 70294]EDO18029.1 hypothetical protein Kpol_1045p13 [Vanderwaltozyma polyspora DSM 70294]
MTTQLMYENDDDQGLFTNRSTMLANFEEWIKMATDNKINSRNSWNFALIDYFYDLNVLRDSENNINFQKASATLDGCVKIYSSRVDSVTTETGKLLSGLAQRKNDKHGNGNGGSTGEDGDDGANDDDGIRIDPDTGLPIADDPDSHSKRRVYNRVLETTLVDFDTIRMKGLDKELNIDPLFKKALVDFDEGGSKSLLLNTLDIDNNCRVVFDAAIKDTNFTKNGNVLNEEDESSESELESELESESELDGRNGRKQDTDEKENDGIENASHGTLNNEISMEDISRDNERLLDDEKAIIEDEILVLGMDFINFETLEKCEISSSMKQLKSVVNDINQAKGFIDGVNSKFGNYLSEDDLKEADLDDNSLDADVNFDMDDNNYADDDANIIDNHETTRDSLKNISTLDEASAVLGNMFEQDLMSYFDESLKKSWRGRDHWKVRNYKKKILNETGDNNQKSSEDEDGEETNNNENASSNTKKSKKKSTEEVDFFKIDNDLEEIIFAPRQRKVIEIPQKSRMNPDHFLLPDDYQFSTDKITRLFIKPLQRMRLFQNKRNKGTITSNHNESDEGFLSDGNAVPEPANEEFWAKNYELQEQGDDNGNDNFDNDGIDIQAADLENPFEEDNGIDFNQAFDSDSNDIQEGPTFSIKNEDNGKLPINDRKVNYSRVAKKVDVRRLKNNLWKSIKILVGKVKDSEVGTEVLEIKLTDIAHEMSKMYSDETRKDISTSFCFICLLHLCNEHGLSVKNMENYDDLTVVYDISKESVEQ